MVVAVLNALQKVFVQLGRSAIEAFPQVVGALVILLVGYLVALLVEWVVSNLLERLKFDEYTVKKTNLHKSIGNVSLEFVFSLVAKWYTFALFLLPAADAVKWPTLASFLKVVAAWVPTLIGASLVGLFGVIAASYVREKIVETKAKSASLVADFVKVIVLVVTALVVLRQVGLDISLVENSLFIVLSGIMLALALALGIGFGLAMKDEAKGLVRDFLKRL